MRFVLTSGGQVFHDTIIAYQNGRTFAAPQGGWKAGTYHLDVYLNGEFVGSDDVTLP